MLKNVEKVCRQTQNTRVENVKNTMLKNVKNDQIVLKMRKKCLKMFNVKKTSKKTKNCSENHEFSKKIKLSC